MSDHLASLYEARFESILVPTAEKLQFYIREILIDAERVDAVVARGKTPERFASKALKLQEDGSLKYKDPLNEIEDQIGARINVLYLSDVPRIKRIVDDYFTAIERQAKQPEKDEEFGYFGEHFILRLPDDVIPDGLESAAPNFFELQIKTVFQHAWSECNHDIGYKASGEITPHQRRQMAFSAAQSWGADQIFLELANALVPPADNDA